MKRILYKKEPIQALAEIHLNDISRFREIIQANKIDLFGALPQAESLLSIPADLITTKEFSGYSTASLNAVNEVNGGFDSTSNLSPQTLSNTEKIINYQGYSFNPTQWR